MILTRCINCSNFLGEDDIDCQICGSNEVEDLIEINCPHCNDIATIFFRGGNCTSCGEWVEICS